jgi:hypothetical protein
MPRAQEASSLKSMHTYPSISADGLLFTMLADSTVQYDHPDAYRGMRWPAGGAGPPVHEASLQIDGVIRCGIYVLHICMHVDIRTPRVSQPELVKTCRTTACGMTHAHAPTHTHTHTHTHAHAHTHTHTHTHNDAHACARPPGRNWCHTSAVNRYQQPHEAQ